MQRIQGDYATEDHLFTQGDPASAIPATVVTDNWLNDVQEEIVNVIEAAGLPLDGGDQTQLLEAIAYLIAEALPSSTRIETDYIDASAMLPSDGSPAEILTTTTNGRRYSYRVLPVDADDDLAITYPMPEGWDRGTVKAKVLWLPDDGETVGAALTLSLAAAAVTPGESLDAALGTTVIISDTVLGDGRLHTSAASPALTVGGTPALGDMIHFVLSRDVDGGTTPMTGEARIIGLWLQYTCNQTVTAW